MSRSFLRLRSQRRSLFDVTVTATATVVLARRRTNPQRRCLCFSQTVGGHSYHSPHPQADLSLVNDQMAPDIWWHQSNNKNSNSNSNSNSNLYPHPPPAVVYPHVISEEEASAISQELLDHRLKRRRYEKGHWDAVITNYREIELYDIHERLERQATEATAPEGEETTAIHILTKVVGRIRNHLQTVHLTPPTDNTNQTSISWLPCHAIDLQPSGQLQAHVDSVRFSGHLVAGLSLLSPAIMRLRYPPPENHDEHEDHGNGHEDHEHAHNTNTDTEKAPGHVDLLLPPRSLYVLTGVARYECSHELLPDGAIFHPPNHNDSDSDHSSPPIPVTRDQRLSIIFRDAKNE